MDGFALVRKVANDLAAGVMVFPTAFETTLRLRKLLTSETTSVGDIAALVARDPLLASKLLQAANSVVLNPAGSRASVTTIPAAVTRIGYDGVRIIALSVAMQQLRQSKPMVPFELLSGEIMAHSQRVGAIASVVAGTCTSLCKDSAFFAGLVHDIGAFFLIYRIATEPGLRIDDAEIDRTLHDWHDHIGHALLTALNVPDEILEAVHEHDDPRSFTSVSTLRDLLCCCHAIEPTLPGYTQPRRWRPPVPDVAKFPACLAVMAVARERAADIEQMISSF